MIVSWRLLRVLLRGLRAPRLGLLDTSEITLRVSLTDLDTNIHVNNGRFLTIMDLGRLDLTARTGLLPVAWRRRWRPVLASAMVRFRRELRPFERFTLRTRLLGWDDRWVFLRQDIVRSDGQIASMSVVKAIFLGPDGPVAPSELAVAGGIDATSPPLPDWLLDWVRSEDALAAA